MASEAPASDGRLEMVDALRGYALMGLFLVHMIEYFELYWLDPRPSAVHDWVFALFAGKAYALFALCFGFSFYIIMHRAGERGMDFSRRFVWRLVVLAAIGWLHGLIYRGDIIVVLAPLGLLLVPLDRIRDNRLLGALAGLSFLLPWPLFRLAAGLAGAAWANQPPHFWSDPTLVHYALGGFGATLATNLWDGQVEKWWFYIESGRVMHIFGLFLLGLILGRTGFFAAPERFARLRWWALGIALAIGAALSLGGNAAVDSLGFGADQAMPRAALRDLLGAYRDLAWTAVSGLAVIALWQSAARPLLRPLVAVGRMTLTFYIGQSLLFVPVFYGFGLGLYAGIGQARALLLGLAAFAVQLGLARWWMRHYRYGPLEWTWRALTYTTMRIPFRRGA
jgi:uncharacterized protein